MTEPAQTSLISSATTETTPPPANPEAIPDPAPSTVESEGQAPGAEGPPAAEPAPLALADLSLPEGFEMPEDVGASFLELVNSPPATRAEFGNALIAMHTSLLESVAGQYAQQWESTQEQWRTEVQNLPEIGGKNLDKSLSEIAKVIDRYGDKDARDALAMTGAGNHPALVRLFHKIAKDLNEAPPVQGTAATDAPKDRASRMFGSTQQG